MPGLSEHSIDKMSISVRIPLELCMKVERRFSAAHGSRSESYVRALAEAVRGVCLTKRDLAAIESARKENLARRLELRAKRSRSGKGGRP